MARTTDKLRDLAGRGGNPQEIIWSLCRRDCRQRFLRFPAKPGAGENGHHSAYFAEFLWRLRNTGAPSDVPERAAKAASFWRLLATLRRVHRDADWGEAAPQFDVYKVPAALVEKFDSMIPSLVHDQKRRTYLLPANLFKAHPLETEHFNVPAGEQAAARAASLILWGRDYVIENAPCKARWPPQ